MIPAGFHDLLERARTAMRDDRPTEAMVAYKAALDVYPESYEANRELGLLLTHSNIRHVAAEHLRHALRLAPRPDPALARELASTLHHCGYWLEAADVYMRLLQSAPEDAEAWAWLPLNLYLGGRTEEASNLAMARHAAGVQARRRSRIESSMLAPRYAICFAGEMVCRLGSVHAARQFGWADYGRQVFVDGSVEPCNSHLVQYWRPFFRFTDDPAEFAAFARRGLVVNCEFIPVGAGRAAWQMLSWSMALFERKRRRLPPLFRLSEDDRAFGRSTLRTLGLPENAWFVAFHMRSTGFHLGVNRDQPVNAEIEDYLPAMEEVVRRGGWAIRVGNAKMEPLPPRSGIVDYVHTEALSPRMDVFLAAEARLAVASHSGWGNIPQCFGTPVLWTNFMPLLGMGAGPDDRILFKRLIAPDGREMTFAETFRPPFMNQRTEYFLQDRGLKVSSCTPEEIHEGVVECLDIPARDDDPLWRAFENASGFPVAAGYDRPALSWLRRYENLLPR